MKQQARHKRKIIEVDGQNDRQVNGVLWTKIGVFWNFKILSGIRPWPRWKAYSDLRTLTSEEGISAPSPRTDHHSFGRGLWPFGPCLRATAANAYHFDHCWDLPESTTQTASWSV